MQKSVNNVYRALYTPFNLCTLYIYFSLYKHLSFTLSNILIFFISKHKRKHVWRMTTWHSKHRHFVESKYKIDRRIIDKRDWGIYIAFLYLIFKIHVYDDNDSVYFFSAHRVLSKLWSDCKRTDVKFSTNSDYTSSSMN